MAQRSSLALVACALGVCAYAACGTEDTGTGLVGAGGSPNTTSGDGGLILTSPQGPGGGGSSTTSGTGAGGSGEGGSVPAELEWSKIYGDNPDGDVFVSDVDVDANGNIVLVGSFRSNVNFGGTTLTTTNASDYNVFVAKLDAAGNHVWSKAFGDGLNQFGRGVAADANGDVIVVGAFIGSINFGGSTFTSSGTMFSSAFVAKLSGADGSHVWSDDYGDYNVQEAHAVDTDASGNVVVVGQFQTDLGIGGLTTTGDFDMFLLKLQAANGSLMFAKQYGDDLQQDASSVAVAASGAIVIGGTTEGAIDFGGGALANAAGNRGTFARLDGTTGAQVFAKLLAGDGETDVRAVAFAPDGDALVGGSFAVSIDLGGLELTTPGANDDVFVARYDASGGVVYGRRFGDSLAQRLHGLAADSGGYALLAGQFGGTLAIGPDTWVSGGGFDGFVAKLHPDGAAYFSRGFGDGLLQRAQAVARGAGDSVVVVGEFSGSIDLGGGAVGGAHTNDIFVASYAP